MSRYPSDWRKITEENKRRINWTCERCHLDCCPAWYAHYLGYSRNKQKRLELAVHHSDYCPENNSPSNLRVLCTACHLYYHQRRKGNNHPGQLWIPDITIESDYPLS